MVMLLDNPAAFSGCKSPSLRTPFTKASGKCILLLFFRYGARFEDGIWITILPLSYTSFVVIGV